MFVLKCDNNNEATEWTTSGKCFTGSNAALYQQKCGMKTKVSLHPSGIRFTSFKCT